MNAHLLIVDDDERIRSLLKQFLLRNGFLVSAARDATHARKILSGLDFDMIVLDVMMPGEDGVSPDKTHPRNPSDAHFIADRKGRNRGSHCWA